ncbi:MAG TPA: cytochrome c [Chitinophagaceae bacterium]|nr:cytochrome c [Chitinophagaceae bacterium]
MKHYLPVLIVFLLLLTSSFTMLQQPGLKASMERGQKVYAATCIACHQADGLGVQRMNPPLVKTKWVLGNKKALAKIVIFGLKGGEIIIDGDDFHNPMPPQGEQLDDQQIADVLTYVRNSFGNKASAVTPSEVKAARQTTGAAPATKKPAAKTPAKKAPAKQ